MILNLQWFIQKFYSNKENLSTVETPNSTIHKNDAIFDTKISKHLSFDSTVKNSFSSSSYDGLNLENTDILLALSKVQDGLCQIEIFAYDLKIATTNERLFLHHEILMHTFPSSIAVVETEERSFVAVGCHDQSIQLWDINELDPSEPLKTLQDDCESNVCERTKTTSGNSRSISCLEHNHFSRGEILISGTNNGCVKLWDIKKGMCTNRMKHHERKVSVISWNPQDFSVFFTAAQDCTIATLDSRIPGLLTASWQVTSEVEAGLWNNYDPATLIVATKDGLVSFLDLRMVKNNKPVFQFVAHEGVTGKLTNCTRNPGLLATSGDDGKIKLWNISKYVPFPITTLHHKFTDCVCLKFSPSHPYLLAAVNTTGQLYIWEVSES
jgi:WD40 repeat protein